MRYTARSLQDQADRFILLQKTADDNDKLMTDRVAGLTTELAVLKQKIDDQSRRTDDQAAHFKIWDQRWWALLAGVVIAIVTAFIRK